MRVISSLLLLLGMAIAAAGCARQPVAYVAYSPTPATSGIDGVMYGTAAPPAPAVMAGRTYAMVPNTAAPYTASPYAAAPYAANSYAAGTRMQRRRRTLRRPLQPLRRRQVCTDTRPKRDTRPKQYVFFFFFFFFFF